MNGIVDDIDPRRPEHKLIETFEEEKTYYEFNINNPYAIAINEGGNDRKTCPECGDKPSVNEDCEYRCVLCPNNHRWYTYKNGVYMGNPHP